jgi:LuxR family maltose regulon positive regulatory protein
MNNHGGGVTGTQAGAVQGLRRDPAALLPLHVAKTARPQMVRGRVERRRLFDLLDRATRNPVTVVRAGAGWGKTVLVSAWAQTRANSVAWLSLDRHHNDPQVFWSYIVAALRHAGALTPDNPLAEMGSIPRNEQERCLRMANGLGRLPDQTVLVIDDFHEIDDPQVLGEVSDLLRHPPPPLRLILISRTEPALALHRLRTADQLSEMSSDDLAFTADEVAALFRRHGLTLSPDDVATLLDRTDGWAVGLHLGAGFLTGNGGARSVADFAGDTRGVDMYLTDEVLARHPTRERRFLLETSICEQVCADLANAITKDTDGQWMLEGLEHDNDFVVRLGPKPLWFRYHHLLRDVLRHRLDLETPTAVPKLHRRAARWYARHNSVIEALTHAVRARDWAYVGRLVIGQAAPLILSAHRAALVKILHQVPREQLTTTPELMVCAALLLFYAGDYDAIPARVSHVRELLREQPVASRDRADVLLMALQVAADRAVGDMPAVVAVETEQLALLARSPFHDRATLTQLRAIALNSKGLALLWTGHVDAAARELRAAVVAARTAGVELAEMNATGHLALLEMLYGSVSNAAQLASTARNLAERRGWLYTVQSVAAHFAHALVLLERNDLTAAERALRQGQRAHDTEPEAAQRLVLLGVRARLALARGEPARARSFLDEARRERGPRLHVPALDRWLALLDAEVDLATDQPELARQRLAHLPTDQTTGSAHRVILARAALARRDPRRAEELLSAGPTTMPETIATVETGIVAALIADTRGYTTRAVDLLADAVRLAAREGIRRPFVTMSGSRLAELLDRLRLLAPDHAPFVAGIIADIRAASHSPAPTATVEGLSEREADVLRYLPTMMTLAEIATELGVSVNTVKAHTRSIYRKLGAGRRSEAVTHARDTGIL